MSSPANQPRRHQVGVAHNLIPDSGINRLRYSSCEVLLDEGARMIDETGRTSISGKLAARRGMPRLTFRVAHRPSGPTGGPRLSAADRRPDAAPFTDSDSALCDGTPLAWLALSPARRSRGRLVTDAALVDRLDAALAHVTETVPA